MSLNSSNVTRYIYALVDPRDNMIRYVGCAIDVEKRYKEHMKDKSHTPKCQWLSELKQFGLHPHLEILETVESFYKAFSKEEAWINRMLQAGMPLTNSLSNRGTFAEKPPFDWIKGNKLHYIRRTLGIKRIEIITKGDIPINAYNRAEAGRSINTEIAEKILDILNIISKENGGREMELHDLGWIPEYE